MSTPRLVVVGGFSTNKSTLYEVFAAVSERVPLDQSVEEIYTFHDAVNGRRQELEKSLKNAWVVTHSAGAKAVRMSGVRPCAVDAFNPPEPRHPLGLIGGVAELAVRTGREVLDPRKLNGRKAGQALVAHAFEFGRHPFGYGSNILPLSGFSTIKEYTNLQREHPQTSVNIYHADGDELFPEPCSMATAVHYAGGHDRFLVDPSSVLKEVGLTVPGLRLPLHNAIINN